nr:enolase C-terminal domain-like protein [Oceanipulchritudo coccoides]
MPPATPEIPLIPSIPSPTPAASPTARTAALLSLSESTPEAVANLREAGYRTFKLKVGLNKPDDEWDFLQKVVLSLKAGDKLRLDPNRSWDTGTWSFWKPRLNGISQSIEFIEEPFKEQLSSDDMLRQAESSPVPLALDESLAGAGLVDWLDKGWTGYWVIKPTILEDPEVWWKRLLDAKSRVVISSVFETGIGLSSLIHLAQAFPETDHGLRTQAFFDDDFGVPQQGPVLNALTIEEQEDLWKRLPES